MTTFAALKKRAEDRVRASREYRDKEKAELLAELEEGEKPEDVFDAEDLDLLEMLEEMEPEAAHVPMSSEEALFVLKNTGIEKDAIYKAIRKGVRGAKGQPVKLQANHLLHLLAKQRTDKPKREKKPANDS